MSKLKTSILRANLGGTNNWGEHGVLPGFMSSETVRKYDRQTYNLLFGHLAPNYQGPPMLENAEVRLEYGIWVPFRKCMFNQTVS